MVDKKTPLTKLHKFNLRIRVLLTILASRNMLLHQSVHFTFLIISYASLAPKVNDQPNFVQASAAQNLMVRHS